MTIAVPAKICNISESKKDNKVWYSKYCRKDPTQLPGYDARTFDKFKYDG